MLIDEVEGLIEEVKENDLYFKRNTKLYRVNEGDILPYILEALSRQFSIDTFEQMTHRVPPINILKRVVDKLSRIYQPGPTRAVTNGQDKDNELLGWYQKSFQANNKMNLSNEYFNLFKNNLLGICLHDGMPTLKPIPSDRFFVYGKNPINPTKPTHVLTMQGKMQNIFPRRKDALIYNIYTDDEFLVVQDDGAVRTDLMALYGNVDGMNPFGKLPFVYIAKSSNEIIPYPDSDMLAMSLIIPQSFTDLNAGVMFQIFSIMYGIGLTAKDLVYSPNAFWEFKVDPGQEGKTEVGILKPQIDVTQALTLIQAQLTLWFQTIGIRPGSIGQLTADSVVSGISKMIDEMDTSEHRMKQISYFQQAETELWDFVVNYAHPYWRSTNSIDQTLDWTPGVEIAVNFAEQIPMQSRAELLKEQVEELAAGLTTVRRVIRRMNPDLTEIEIDDLLSEIEQESSIKINMTGINNVLQSKGDGIFVKTEGQVNQGPGQQPSQGQNQVLGGENGLAKSAA